MPDHRIKIHRAKNRYWVAGCVVCGRNCNVDRDWSYLIDWAIWHYRKFKQAEHREALGMCWCEFCSLPVVHPFDEETSENEAEIREVRGAYLRPSERCAGVGCRHKAGHWGYHEDGTGYMWLNETPGGLSIPDARVAENW
jgi:hypothetical protein